MVTYNYNVMLDGATSSIQFVIDRITEELSTGPTIERDIEILVGPGNFAGFTIPDGALFPLFNTAYRLVIRSSGDHYPIIDFNYSREEQYVGVDLGSGNPNVTIKGLRIQYFAVGIRAGLNTHYPIVQNCIVNNNRNAGLFFEQCIEAQAIQNVVINGDYGIIVRLCQSALLLHNTIFMNGAISSEVGKSISCIWAELAMDYGGGQNDTGRLHMLGNIGWNTSGRCLTLFLSDVETPGSVISNYNDWVIGDSNNFIVIEDNAYYRGSESRPRRIFNTINAWKALGKDTESKSENPRFISPVKIRKDKNGYALDLNILPVSPVLEMVPSFGYDQEAALEWLPSYFDRELITKDILGNERSRVRTSAGANEKISTSGFFGQDVFSNPLDLDLNKSCATDPFFNILFKELDLWFPKLQRGYFYSNEREFYLYSKKACKYLGELAVTKFYLPSKIIYSKPIKLYVNGTVITDTKYLDIRGNELYLYHLDLEILSGDEEIELEAWISNWNSDSFNYSKVLYRFKISEGETKFYLPEEYVPVGPVIVTDDVAYPTDSDQVCNREFSVAFDENEQKSELKFANWSNLLTNGQFDYCTEDGEPLGWQHSSALVIASPEPYYAVAGSNVCSVANRGFIRRVVPVDASGSYCFSFHAMSFGSGTCNYQIDYYDSNFDSLGMTSTGEVVLANDWRRYALTIGNSGQDFNTIVPQLPYPCIDIGQEYVPTRAAHASIKLEHIYNPAYTGNLLLSALQYEESPVPTLYHRRPFLNELTVEYETSEDNYFVDYHLSMSSVVSLNSDGFIYIPEIPAATYNGPNTPVVTTFHEWKWADGRKNIIPWGRTKGKDKLRKRPDNKYHLIPENKPDIIYPVVATAVVRDIYISPSTPICGIGDENGIGFAISVVDSDGNPHAQNNISIVLSESNLRYPGSLSKKIYGLKEQLSTAIYTKTNSSGMVSLTWVPPKEIDTVYKGPVPTPLYSSTRNDKISYIDTEYKVNQEGNGNVIIFDYLNRPLKTSATVALGNVYSTSYRSDYSYAKLQYPITIGSVKVIVDDVPYIENQIDILDSNQFFVDYSTSTITVKGRVTNIYIEYLPSYVFTSTTDPYRILMYHDKIFDNYDNEITVGYDIVVSLDVTVADPALISVSENSFNLVGQNPLTKKSGHFNTLALDF